MSNVVNQIAVHYLQQTAAVFICKAPMDEQYFIQSTPSAESLILIGCTVYIAFFVFGPFGQRHQAVVREQY
ncbi:MAG: hypothetical protein K9K84_00300 [Methylovulum sp.]|nr:hypothetical protein [Methylovulum sp.]